MDPALAARQFAIPGEFREIGPLGSGNVNDTFLALFASASRTEYVVIQKISGAVFKHPEKIMQNMRVIAEHVEGRLKAAKLGGSHLKIPRLIQTKDGKDYFIDAAGDFWRATTLIASAKSYETAQNAGHALEAGVVLGRFHHLLSDLDVARVQETLPGFHVTPLYLGRYDEIRQTPDARRRAGFSLEARRLEKFIEARRAFAAVLESARERGELKLRLIHGDPKVNNIMLDGASGRGAGIVDLDTVQPGLIHYDFGDALRSMCNPAGEEVHDLTQIRFDLDLCKAFIQGYLEAGGEFLTPADRKYFYDSVRLIVFELGLRFFQDHLAGDIYFKTRYPEQNLIRARVQFRLCERIEELEDNIRRLLD